MTQVTELGTLAAIYFWDVSEGVSVCRTEFNQLSTKIQNYTQFRIMIIF